MGGREGHAQHLCLVVAGCVCVCVCFFLGGGVFYGLICCDCLHLFVFL